MHILITGATGGIGEKLTSHLVKNNTVTALSRNKIALQNLKEKINSTNLFTYSVDVSKSNQVQKTLSNFKRLDVIINCAGILDPVGIFLENDLAKWKKTIEVNLLGTVYTCYYGLPLLLKSRRGKIVNFSGGGGAYPRLHHSAYSTSKTAVVRFSEDLAMEYPGLDINAIAPGAHRTDMWKSETYDAEPEQWGDMNRLKEFIDFLVSGKSDGITGKFIHYKDAWEGFEPEKLSKDIYTLRRVEK